MQFAHLNDCTIHFQTIGIPGDKPIIAFSNSLGTDFRIWRDVVMQLAGKYSVLLYDKRGYGLSDLGTPPYTIGDHAADLAALIDHLGINQATICGISVGGLVAQGLYAARPDIVRSLILCDTAPRIGNAEMWNARIDAIRQSGLEGIADAILERWFTPSYRSSASADYAGYRNMLTRMPAEGYIGTCAALRDADLTAAAGAIDRPVLCVTGDQDVTTPPSLVSEMANLIPSSRFHVIPGSGHLPCIEQPQLLADVIDGFLA